MNSQVITMLKWFAITACLGFLVLLVLTSKIPAAFTPCLHLDSGFGVFNPGGWYYSPSKGQIFVNSRHFDIKGDFWCQQ